jgi:hypothetical protein
VFVALPGSLGGEARLDKAWEALTWWRSLHARPLTTVAANLRYHVDSSRARIDDRIEVTQRLKRVATLIGELARERANVTQMHDIGGVRTVVPSLRHAYVEQGFKFGEGDPAAREVFAAMAELIAAFDRAEVTYEDLGIGLRLLPEVTIKGRKRT